MATIKLEASWMLAFSLICKPWLMLVAQVGSSVNEAEDGVVILIFSFQAGFICVGQHPKRSQPSHSQFLDVLWVRGLDEVMVPFLIKIPYVSVWILGKSLPQSLELFVRSIFFQKDRMVLYGHGWVYMIMHIIPFINNGFDPSNNRAIVIYIVFIHVLLSAKWFTSKKHHNNNNDSLKKQRCLTLTPSLHLFFFPDLYPLYVDGYLRRQPIPAKAICLLALTLLSR